MICKFCQKETVDKSLPIDYSALYATLPSRLQNRKLKVMFCETCLAEYVFWSETAEHPLTVNLYITLNEKTYRWSHYTSEEKGRLFYIEEVGIPGFQVNKKVKLLKTFHKSDELPTITPQNIVEKVKLILLFM